MSSVRVVARIRPLLKHELDKDTIVTAEAPSGDSTATPTILRVPNPKNDNESYSFQFSSVYDQETTQQQLFEGEVSSTVKHLFNGFDTTIFSYGPTGTGKTHTMRGGKSLADRGVIPRLLSNIYRRCRKIEKDTGGATQVDVSMSYYEIYCDRVYDLFEAPEKRTPSGLPIRDNNGKTVVVGLSEKPCSNLKEFEHLYDQANINRSTSATKLNAHSSRSHAILCVKVTQTTEDTVRVSRASAIDLAGSEDNRRTENNKERLVESSAINKSLFVLAQCVEAISKKQSRVPYRESKMTRILSLGQNNGLTLMILNLAPTRAYHLDTLSSLNFANRTKKIEIAEVENEVRTIVRPLAATASIGGANITRQPLRPINAAHNTNIPERITEKKKEKLIKAFSVYSDAKKPAASRTSNLPLQNQGVRRTETHKRAADNALGSRPAKSFRTGDAASRVQDSGMSLASIEALVEARVAQCVKDHLAEKALQDASTSVPTISAELQKRLDDLENRIEAQEDEGKNPGLEFLLMGKQHKARGEDASALRMYQMALPYFPENEKLKGKIRGLEERIRIKKEADSAVSVPKVPSRLMAPLKPERKDAQPKPDESFEDGDFAPIVDGSDHDESYASDGSFTYKSKATRKPKKTTKKLPIFRDAADHNDTTSLPHEQTPRTKQLLRIINSRDAIQIRALKGVGSKRADAIVSCLLELEDAEVHDLEGLALLKGVGGRTVENMRMGLTVGYDF
ncbi:P-loop containing nucleoside triphosphate hydrolase protein [Dendryphion nanum]|uniref:P-loop containing nucleoside triphosphate hydrolase protein n=1 Tax=Dendryphion nanum TaxID=256645 RepID=A0A9P9DGQ3_9PLEO|nr:P-loop containing nucleoside triphosphate hydrolase protein [Dendryphion nanum]